MACRDERAPLATALRRGDKPMTKNARRDVRWVLMQEPGKHVYAVNVHGVHVVYRHALQQPAGSGRQHANGAGNGQVGDGTKAAAKADVAMADAGVPKRKPRKNSEARVAKRELRWQNKVQMRTLLAALRQVGGWIRREQKLQSEGTAAEAKAAIAQEARERDTLQQENYALRLERDHAKGQAARSLAACTKLQTELASWDSWWRKSERNDCHGDQMDVEHVPPKRAAPDSPSASSSSSTGTREHGGIPPARRGLFIGDAAVEQERRLLEDASEALAAKGRGRGRGMSRGGGGYDASWTGRGGWDDGGRGGRRSRHPY